MAYSAFARISPACRESTKTSVMLSESASKEYSKVESLKKEVVTKRSAIFAFKLGCIQIYYQNRITEIQDGIIDQRRELAKVQSKLDLANSQRGVSGHIEYWKTFFEVNYKNLKQLVTTFTGSIPSLPELKSAYIARLKKQKLKIQNKILEQTEEVSRLQLEAEHVGQASEKELLSSLSVSSQKLDHQLASSRSVLMNHLNFLKSDRSCSKKEIKDLSYSTQTMSAKDLEYLLTSLNDLPDVDEVARDLEDGKCELTQSFYSGEHAKLIPKN